MASSDSTPELHPDPQTATLTLPSGRVLGWTIYGGPLSSPTDQFPSKVIFYMHGFPGSRVEAGYFSPALLQHHHARCVAIDRPGMGLSTHDPQRRILDWPADVLAVADALGVHSFSIIAVSGGSPYGLACARSANAGPMAGRLRGVAIVSGVYPFGLGVDGMLPGPRVTMAVGKVFPRFVTSRLLDWFFGRAARNPDPRVLEAVVDGEMRGRPEHELAAYRRDEVRRVAIAGLRESFRQGAAGVAHELMLYHDWGFDLEEVDGRVVQMWHGMLDRNVPFAMAQKAAQKMVNVETHFIQDHGHLDMPVVMIEEIIQRLLRDEAQNVSTEHA